MRLGTVSQVLGHAINDKDTLHAKPIPSSTEIEQASATPPPARSTKASTTPISGTTEASDSPAPSEDQDDSPSSDTLDGDTELLKNAKTYVNAIMDPDDPTFDRLSCPRLDAERYKYLKQSSSENPSYYFALNFRQKVDVLPRLMGSVVEVIRFLGPKSCVVSIVEGHSTDGSFEVLKVLEPELEALGVVYHFVRSDVDPKAGDRIGALAELRNLALEPLTAKQGDFTLGTTVIFLNDVAICSEDILELVHQKQALGADVTCGLDWTYVGKDPTFYDVWVARTIRGDSFFEIPPDGNWNSAWNLFWNSPEDQATLRERRPFQVFSCWNGAAVFGARPLWDEGGAV